MRAMWTAFHTSTPLESKLRCSTWLYQGDCTAFREPSRLFRSQTTGAPRMFPHKIAAGRAGEPGGRGAQSGIMLHAARFAQGGTQVIDDGDMTRIILGLAIVGVVEPKARGKQLGRQSGTASVGSQG
jgi:hypothetical protein